MTAPETQLLHATERLYAWLYDPEPPEQEKLRLDTVRLEVESALAVYESDVARVIKRKREARLNHRTDASPSPPRQT